MQLVADKMYKYWVLVGKYEGKRQLVGTRLKGMIILTVK